MYHSPSREQTVAGLQTILTKSRICGPPTDLDFLAAILRDETFIAGKTLTRFLNNF